MNYFDILKTFIEKDITVAINGDANYLVCSLVYTRILKFLEVYIRAI